MRCHHCKKTVATSECEIEGIFEIRCGACGTMLAIEWDEADVVPSMAADARFGADASALGCTVLH